MARKKAKQKKSPKIKSKKVSKEHMRIEYVPLSEIKKWPKNPKQHDTDLIDKSIDRFGYVRPIMVDENTGRMVAGHGRLDTLILKKKNGDKPPDRIKVEGKEWLLPVIRGVHFKNEEEAKAYLIADNRLSEIGGWDDNLLLELLDGLKDVNTIGFSKTDLADLNLINFVKPDLDGMVPDDVLKEKSDSVVKDGNWFYVEFYEKDKLFEKMKNKLKDYMRTGHELDPILFEKMVDAFDFESYKPSKKPPKLPSKTTKKKVSKKKPSKTGRKKRKK